MTPAATTARSPGQKLPDANDQVAEVAARAAAAKLSDVVMMSMDTEKRGSELLRLVPIPFPHLRPRFFFRFGLSAAITAATPEAGGSESSEERSKGFQWVIHVTSFLCCDLNHTHEVCLIRRRGLAVSENAPSGGPGVR